MKVLVVVLAGLMLIGCVEQDPKLRHKYFVECIKVFDGEIDSMSPGRWNTMIDNCRSSAYNQSYIEKKHDSHKN